MSRRRVIRPARRSARPGQSAAAIAGLLAIAAVLLVAGGLGVLVLLGAGSGPRALLGGVLAALLVAGAVGAALTIGYPRAGRLEVVVDDARLVLPAPPALPWVNRVVAPLAVLLALPAVLELTGVPGVTGASGVPGGSGGVGAVDAGLPVFGVVTCLGAGLAALPAAVRAWRGRARYSALTLDPSGVRFVGGRGESAVGWGEVRAVRLEGARLRLIGAGGGAVVDLGIRDLASDARLVADLLDLYRRRPDLRREIGPAALPRLEQGDLT